VTNKRLRGKGISTERENPRESLQFPGEIVLLVRKRNESGGESGKQSSAYGKDLRQAKKVAEEKNGNINPFQKRYVGNEGNIRQEGGGDLLGGCKGPIK